MILQSIWNSMLLRQKGNSSADTNFQALVTVWANEAAKEVWSGKGLEVSPDWWFLQATYTFPTVVDQMTYDLPAELDSRKVFSLRQKEDGVTLIYIDQRVMDEKIPDPETEGSGNPLWYTIYGRDATTKKPYIRLLPIPSSIITMYLRFYMVMDEFDNSDSLSTIKLPDKYDSLLMDGILYKWYEYDPERGDANAKKAEFIDGIKKATEDNKVNDESLIAATHGGKQKQYPGFQYPVPT